MTEPVEDYKTSLAQLTGNHKTVINLLTILADDYQQHAAEIVQAIDTHVHTVPREMKLPAIYLADSILKNVAAHYRDLFARIIVKLFLHVFINGDERVRMSLYKLRQTWTDIFPKSKLYELDLKVHSEDAAWPLVTPQSRAASAARSAVSAAATTVTVSTATPSAGVRAPHSVHVNPRFIGAGNTLAPPVPTPPPQGVETKPSNRVDPRMSRQQPQQQQQKKPAEPVDVKPAVAILKKAINSEAAKKESTAAAVPADPRAAKRPSPPIKTEVQEKPSLFSRVKKEPVDEVPSASEKSQRVEKARREGIKDVKREPIDTDLRQEQQRSRPNGVKGVVPPRPALKNDGVGGAEKRRMPPPGTLPTPLDKDERVAAAPGPPPPKHPRRRPDQPPPARRPPPPRINKAVTPTNAPGSHAFAIPPQPRGQPKPLSPNTLSSVPPIFPMPDESSLSPHDSAVPTGGPPAPSAPAGYHPPPIYPPPGPGASGGPPPVSHGASSAVPSSAASPPISGGLLPTPSLPSSGHSMGGHHNNHRSLGGPPIHHRPGGSSMPPPGGNYHHHRRSPPLGPPQNFHSMPPQNRPFNAPGPAYPPYQGPSPQGIPPVAGPPVAAPPPQRHIISDDAVKLEGIPANNRIFVDGRAHEVFYIGETAVIERNGLPHRIYFTGVPRNVVIDGVPHMLKFGESKEVLIDGHPHVLRFGAPSRELYMGDFPFKGSFGGPPIFATINAVRHEIRLSGPAPEVKIEPDPSYDLARFMQEARVGTARPPEPPAPKLAPKPQEDVGAFLDKLSKSGLLDIFKKKTAAEKAAASLPQPREPPPPPIPSEVRGSGDRSAAPHPLFEKSPFDMRYLKIRYDNVVAALHSPQTNCPQCGLRVSSLSGERYERHMDWHVRKNLAASATATAAARQWYGSAKEWIHHVEAGEDDEGGAGEGGTSGEGGGQGRTETGAPVVQSIVSSEINSKTCAVCGEEFEEYYDEEADAWKMRDCVKVGKKTCHTGCAQDATMAEEEEGGEHVEVMELKREEMEVEDSKPSLRPAPPQPHAGTVLADPRLARLNAIKRSPIV